MLSPSIAARPSQPTDVLTNRLAHGPCVENLQARSAAHSQWHDMAPGLVRERSRIFDVAGQLHTITRAIALPLRGRGPPDPARRDVTAG